METPQEPVAATSIVDTGTFGRAFVERAPQPIAITSGSAHRIRWANPAFCELLGRERAQLLDRPCREILPGRNAWVVLALLNRAFRTGETQVGVVLSAAGTSSTTEAAPLVVWPIINQAGLVTGLVLEVSERTAQMVAHQRAEQTAADARAINERLLVASLRERERAEQSQHLVAELERRASHDILTGLPNRALFSERLRHTMEAASRDRRQFAVLYVDLDRFKEINDTFGHQAGDRLLRQIAARLRQTLRDSDTLARLGGDEFAVLLPVFERAADVEVTATRLLAALSRPFAVQGKQRQLVGSIGVAIYPQHGLDAATLIRRADEAMYRAKHLGGGQVITAKVTTAQNAPSRTPQPATRPPAIGRDTAGLVEPREVNTQVLHAGLRERERAKEGQRQRELWFRALARHAAEIVVVADAAGFIRYVNPALTRSLGHQADTVTGRRGLRLVHPADRARVWRLLTASLQPPNDIAPFIVRVRHADRSWRWFEAVGMNLLHEPAVTGLVLTLRDMTKQQRATADQATAPREIAAALADERLRLARALHSGARRELLTMSTQLAERQRRSGIPGEHPDPAAVRTQQQLLAVVRQLDELIGELCPPGLAESGLAAALAGYVAHLQCLKPGSRPTITLDVTADDARLAPETALALIRIAQEALWNALRYASARHIAVSLRQDDQRVTLRVQHDGQDFQAPTHLSALTNAGRFGQADMAERAEFAGGQLAIRSRPGRTILTASLPLCPPGDDGDRGDAARAG